MEKIKKYYIYYKYAIYLFICCFLITLSTNIIPKGDYNKYIVKKQIAADCENGWLDANLAYCINAKKDKEIQDNKAERDNSDELVKLVLPSKVLYDYMLSLGSVLEVLFIGYMGFQIGHKFKKEKFKDLWKTWDLILLSISLEVVLNYLYVISNGMFLSTDFLRFIFEIVVLLITLLLGRWIK